MRTVRAMIVVLTALSLALLPVAGLAAPAASTDSASVHADCCPMNQDCGKQSKSHCNEDAACAFKCAGVSEVPLTSSETASIANASTEPTPIPRLSLPVALNPPSPPPRT